MYYYYYAAFNAPYVGHKMTNRRRGVYGESVWSPTVMYCME